MANRKHMTCTIEGCAEIHYSLGYCLSHYRKLKRHGDPLAHAAKTTFEERFWSRVEKAADDKCWLWTGRTEISGYGEISHKGKEEKAHRASWFLAYGAFPETCLLHSCDNRLCVNPAHLREGTRQDNAADMVARDRQAKGEQNGSSKLTGEQVRTIRRLYSEGRSQKSLAREYGVDKNTIRDIRKFRTWSHVI